MASFVDSDALWEGAELGGQIRGQGLVLLCWWTFCSLWAFVLEHKHWVFFFPVEATYFYFWRCINYRLFTFCFVSSASSLLLASTACPFPFVGVVVGGWWMTKQIVGAVNCITELLPPRTLFWANAECVFSDSKSLQVHSEVIWGLHPAFNLRKSSMNNLGSCNVTWEWRLWATN